MFIYLKNDTVHPQLSKASYSWFTAIGKSMLDVVYYYQIGVIKRHQIKVFGKSLDVLVLNNNHYNFTPGSKYNLQLNPASGNIDLIFEEGDHQSTWHKTNLTTSDVRASTWDDLFGKDKTIDTLNNCEDLSESSNVLDDLDDLDNLDVYSDIDAGDRVDTDTRSEYELDVNRSFNLATYKSLSDKLDVMFAKTYE